MSQFPTSHPFIEYSTQNGSSPRSFLIVLMALSFIYRDSFRVHPVGALLLLPPTWLTFLLKPAILTSKHLARFHLSFS
jgi:hypothetical protein